MKLIVMLAVFVFVLLAFFRKLIPAKGNFTNVSKDEVAELKRKHPNLVVLDVRTPQEIKNGKIKNVLEANILSPSFSQEVSKLDPSKPYLVYCRSGNRSAKACKHLEDKGFKTLYNLQGGYHSSLSK